MSQFGRPAADVTVADWTAAPLYAKMDEVSPDDADYIESHNNTNSSCEVSLSGVGDPQASTGHIVRYRFQKSGAFGNARDLTVGLYVGAALVAQQTHTDISSLWGAGSFTLSGAGADAITDYADLRLRFTSGGTTGGSGSSRRGVRVSWAELEVPDVPVATVPDSVGVIVG